MKVELERVIAVVGSDPELPGDIPDDLWLTFRVIVAEGDRRSMANALRVVARATKESIVERLKEEFDG